MFQGGKPTIFKIFNLNDINFKYNLCENEFFKHFENALV